MPNSMAASRAARSAPVWPPERIVRFGWFMQGVYHVLVLGGWLRQDQGIHNRSLLATLSQFRQGLGKSMAQSWLVGSISKTSPTTAET
jgi:hypothetical protein